MTHKEACTDCGKPPPSSDTDHTLISRHGWRVSRTELPRGGYQFAWRCPECWKVFKDLHSSDAIPPSSRSQPTGVGPSRPPAEPQRGRKS